MDSTHDQLQPNFKEHDTKTPKPEENNPTPTHKPIHFNLPKLKHLTWWLRVTTYILCLLLGQTTAILLGRLYYDNGGNSKWLATLVQSAGFPILAPLFYLSYKNSNLLSDEIYTSRLRVYFLLYFSLGIVLTFNNLMYSYRLLYLPVSTYSLLCATQLGFNAVTSYFINAQKFTILILNSVVILSISACILGINAKEGDDSRNISEGKFVLGFLCTIGASAVYSLYLSSVQLSFKKVIKRETFKTVLDMQVYPSFVATISCIVGLFASGEWMKLPEEMKNYKTGRVSYSMTLFSAAISWQISSIGILGLVFEVCSLFSNVIGTLGLPLVPVFAVVFFHDKMNGLKVISLVLAVWGFVSYIYQHYLDDIEATKDSVEGSTTNSDIQIC